MSFLSYLAEVAVAIVSTLPLAFAAATWKQVESRWLYQKGTVKTRFVDDTVLPVLAAISSRVQFPRDLGGMRLQMKAGAKAAAAALGCRLVEYLSEDGQHSGYWVLPKAVKGKPDMVMEPAAKGLTVLWLHGGGYVFGDPRMDLSFLGKILDAVSSCAGVDIPVRLLSLRYPLAPEEPYPAAVMSVTAAYEKLLKAIHSENIVLGGHSAGGGLALAVCQNLRLAGLPQPRALLLMSPFVELSTVAKSYMENNGRDAITANFIRQCSCCYVGSAGSSADPMASPLRETSFTGYPREACVYYGTHEVFRDDVAAWVQKARDGGVGVEEIIAEGGNHLLPFDADSANVQRIVDFLVRIATPVGRSLSENAAR